MKLYSHIQIQVSDSFFPHTNNNRNNDLYNYSFMSLNIHLVIVLDHLYIGDFSYKLRADVSSMTVLFVVSGTIKIENTMSKITFNVSNNCQ